MWRAQRYGGRIAPDAVPVESLRDDLVRLGLRPGETVMVHASLRRLGPVEGGAAGVVDAIDAAVGPDGTVLMLLGARDDWAWVNRRPEPERAALLADAEPFDHRTTPADPEIGVLAEVFRTLPGTVVNDHPESRFAARGARATELVDDAPWDDYYGPGSPLERLIEARGRILRLGADPDTVTALHHAEYLAHVPSKRRLRRHRRVLTPDGPQICTVECLDDETGIVPWDGEDYFAIILREYVATGRASQGMVANAQSELLDAADLVDFGARWMSDAFCPSRLGR
ncbi:MAG TPA: AAC(3) family N-acetyltransferase [Acidimicrobiales bacterium]